VLHPVVPAALVPLFLGPLVHSHPMLLVVLPVAQIVGAVGQSQFAQPLSHVVPHFALEGDPVFEGEGALTPELVELPVSGVVVVVPGEGALAVLHALHPLPAVDRVVPQPHLLLDEGGLVVLLGQADDIVVLRSESLGTGLGQLLGVEAGGVLAVGVVVGN